MRVRTRAIAAAALTSFALVATACGGGGSNNPAPANSQAGGTGGGAISVRGCTRRTRWSPATPQRSAAATSRHHLVEAGALQRQRRSARERHRRRASRPRTTRTSPSRSSDYKFSDGTPVTAKSFVDAWNYTAYGAERPAGVVLLRRPSRASPTLQCADDTCKARAEVQDHVRAQGGRRPHLHHQDQREGLEPAGPARLHRVRPAAGLVLRRTPPPSRPEADRCRSVQGRRGQRHPDRGEQEPQLLRQVPGPADKVTFRIYTDPTAAYNGRGSGNLDFTDIIPPDQLVGDAYKTDLPDRTLVKPSGRHPGRHVLPDRRPAEGPEHAQGHLDGHRPGD